MMLSFALVAYAQLPFPGVSLRFSQLTPQQQAALLPTLTPQQLALAQNDTDFIVLIPAGTTPSAATMGINATGRNTTGLVSPFAATTGLLNPFATPAGLLNPFATPAGLLNPFAALPLVNLTVIQRVNSDLPIQDDFFLDRTVTIAGIVPGSNQVITLTSFEGKPYYGKEDGWFFPLQAGTQYFVRQISLFGEEGYLNRVTYTPDCSGTLKEGQNKTCTITNTLIQIETATNSTGIS